MGDWRGHDNGLAVAGTRAWLFGGWSPDFSRSAWTIALTILTFTACVLQSLWGWDAVMRAVGFVPSAVWQPSSWFTTLPGQALPVALTWFTYVFPHMGWGHMASNVAGLLIFGSIVEPMMGTGRYVAMTVIGTVLGIFGLAAIHPLGMTAIAGGSLLLCTIIGVWFAAYSQGWWRGHRFHVAVLEVAALAGLIAWLVLREPPPESTALMGALWHVPPLMVGWFGFRAASALQARAARPTSSG